MKTGSSGDLSTAVKSRADAIAVGERQSALDRIGEARGAAPAKRLAWATRRNFSAEDKIRIVLEGLQGDDSIAELCREENIARSGHPRPDRRAGAGAVKAEPAATGGAVHRRGALFRIGSHGLPPIESPRPAPQPVRGLRSVTPGRALDRRSTRKNIVKCVSPK